MERPSYIIRGGVAGRERLRLLSRVIGPGTREVFAKIDVQPGWTCWDVGCGGGDVSRILAELVAPGGMVTGTDLDPTMIEIAKTEAAEQHVDNVVFRQADVDDGWNGAPLDLVYARFLLSHLRTQLQTLSAFRAALRPEGWVAIEDVDFAGCFCYPPSRAFDRYVELYTASARARGADPYIGPRLPGMLLDTGFENVRVHISQPAGLNGDVKRLTSVTMANIGDAVVAEGLATLDELEACVSELESLAEDRRTVMSNPRVVQVWATAPRS